MNWQIEQAKNLIRLLRLNGYREEMQGRLISHTELCENRLPQDKILFLKLKKGVRDLKKSIPKKYLTEKELKDFFVNTNLVESYDVAEKIVPDLDLFHLGEGNYKHLKIERKNNKEGLRYKVYYGFW
jgi:hypothetical protein